MQLEKTSASFFDQTTFPCAATSLEFRSAQAVAFDPKSESSFFKRSSGKRN
jgi:hypothetical protein